MFHLVSGTLRIGAEGRSVTKVPESIVASASHSWSSMYTPAMIDSVTYRLESPHCSHSLLGLAPLNTALDTPLSWEQPHCYFVELHPCGMRLWSETLGLYGTPFPHVSACAVVGTEIGFHRHDSGVVVSVNGIDGGIAFRNFPRDLGMFPCVTLFEVGASVSIVT